MDKPLGDPLFGDFLRVAAERSGERAAGHLRRAALVHPARQALRMRPDNPIALRMGDDRGEPGKLQLVQGLVHRRRNREFAEFDEQIILLVDGVRRRILFEGLQVLQIHMEIGAGGEHQPAAEMPRNLLAQRAHALGIEIVGVVGVRRGHDVRDAPGNRRFRHFQSRVKSRGAVVNSRKKMAMNVNHEPPAADHT